MMGRHRARGGKRTTIQLAAEAGLAARDMAQTMLTLEHSGLLVWFPESQLYLLNSVE
jgi:hypothetical protein